MQHKANHLAGETSPYLLQHAYNPVEWYPWGNEALQRAQKENKPILVSIGYSACHWCHVMERESFEDPSIAAVMNEHFINIKVDREERPDLDHIYMDAVQAISGSGGWPLNVFLTPQLQPFYGGTYFPPQALPQRPSWQQVLEGIARAFKEQRPQVEQQAGQLTAHLFEASNFIAPPAEEELATVENAGIVRDLLMAQADKDWGGFGQAPKFPQTNILRYLLRYGHLFKDPAALNQVTVTLDRMIGGGIYDQTGGGFARYATDTEWRVPHFEKMLYDNALLLQVLAEMYQATGEPRYKRIIEQTTQFIQREMTSPEGGCYAALDADSEGVEGKFYTWEYSELKELLPRELFDLFEKVYGIQENGNWEGRNILYLELPADDMDKLTGLKEKELNEKLAQGHRLLLAARATRVRPGLDDKIILGWNALYNTALSKCWAATGISAYREQAEAHMEFLFRVFADREKYYHTYKNGESKFPAYLDDLASWIEALIHLQEITGNTHWLQRAEEICNYVIQHFSEQGTGFFYYTAAGQDDVIIRKKEVYDGAVPSGNSLMACNLYRLSFLLDRREWREQARQMLSGMSAPLLKYPSSFGLWAQLLLELATGTREIAVVGKGAANIADEILSKYLPHKVLMYSEKENSEFPLIADKKMADPALIYNCKDFVCDAPVSSIDEFLTSL